MNRFRRRSFEGMLVLLVLATLASCATIQVKTIPESPPASKLRVFVQSFTVETLEPSKKHATVRYGTAHDAFVEKQTRRVEKILEETGIYEVVSTRDVQASVADQHITYNSIERNNWSLAREIGRGVHADYAMIITRSKQQGQGGRDFLFQGVLINTETGKNYSAGFRFEGVTRVDNQEQVKLIRATYRKIFNQAKEDMLAVAVKKGRAFVPGKSPAPVKQEPEPAAPQILEAAPVQEKPEQQSAAVPAPVRPPAPAPVPTETVPLVPAKQEQPAAVVPEPAPTAMRQEAPAPPDLAGAGLIEPDVKREPSAKKLVVYDFDSNEQYRTVALILVEALREEVFKLKQYILVNREDLQKVLAEMALQQTGLIDEKEAVRTGKGMAANQVVTGQLGMLGKTFVMQAKRVDVETFRTLGLASTKFTEGQEDEVLNNLPEFTKALVGLQ